MNKLFTLIENNEDNVIIQVNVPENDNLTLARNPYIKKEYDYITVTKGRNHVMTIINKDGSSWAFHWGDGGYTLVSDNVEELKRKVINFIEQECYIPLNLIGEIKEARIFFNKNYGKWQLTLNDKAHIWSSTAKNLEDMKKWVNDYIVVEKWEHKIAVTGIDVWHAVI